MIVKLFASLRITGMSDRIEIHVGPDATVAHALELLFAHAPSLREEIMTADGLALQPHINVMVKGRLIRDLQGLQTPVTNDVALSIFPPVAGG